MPRPLRPVFAGAIYHLTTAGVARCVPLGGRADAPLRPPADAPLRSPDVPPVGRLAGERGPRPLERCLVYTDDVDRARFLEFLAAAVLRRAWRCHAYCLMGTHYHLLVETRDPDVSAGVQYLNGRYAQWFNRRHGRRGHLFGARFHSELVSTDSHLVELSRYIVLNPIRAGLCVHPAEWRWSSYLATAGAAPQPLFLSVAWLLAQFATSRIVARAHYRAWVDAGRETGALRAA